MNAILEPFKALWRRKLWPVAIALVAALVAVPMVLAKNPEPAPAPANASASTADAGMPATFVSAAEAPEDGARRRVLGAAKDPFAPAGLSKKIKAERRKAAAAAKKAAAAAKAAKESAKSTTGTSSGSSSGSGSGAGTGSGTTVPPVSAPPTPAPTVPKYSIKVNFGKVDDALETKTVERLKVLPNEDAPLLIYRGVEDGGKVAVFELTGTVDAMGDGKCEPSPEDCQILKLKAGETEFLTISDTGTEADAQYQLDLVKINQKQTTETSELTKAGSTGMSLLKHLASKRTPRYAFDSTTGTLHKLSKKSASKLTKAAQRKSL